MITARLPALRRSTLTPWLRSGALGAAVGGAVVVGHELGVWVPLAAATGEIARALNRLVGPVWIPMFGVALRVGWLAGRALRTRFGWGAGGAPVRPELGQLAPLFEALGLCGTVWGLSAAFDALDGGGFLERLPALLGGLGAAMTSTLVGLGLQIGTLLLAAFNPTWSQACLDWRAGTLRVALDGRRLGETEDGLQALILALDARQPEAVRLCFAARVPPEQRARVLEVLWQRTDSAIPMREVLA